MCDTSQMLSITSHLSAISVLEEIVKIAVVKVDNLCKIESNTL